MSKIICYQVMLWWCVLLKKHEYLKRTPEENVKSFVIRWGYLELLMRTGGHLILKALSFQYRNSHYENKTIFMMKKMGMHEKIFVLKWGTGGEMLSIDPSHNAGTSTSLSWTRGGL